MKKIFTLLALIFILASCTGKDKEKIVSTLTEDTKIEQKEAPESNEELLKELENEIVEVSDELGDDSETDDNIEEVTTSEGQYVAYSKEALDSSSGDKVLFFHATWCPSCKSADKNLSKEEIPVALNIFKVDYDSSSDLKKKYGVLAQHTFVLVDENGEMIKKWSGGRTVKDILEAIK